MSTTNQETIKSPCIGVCAMSEATGLCHGCYRSIDEIQDWWDMTPDQRDQVINMLEKRRAKPF